MGKIAVLGDVRCHVARYEKERDLLLEPTLPKGPFGKPARNKDTLCLGGAYMMASAIGKATAPKHSVLTYDKSELINALGVAAYWNLEKRLLEGQSSPRFCLTRPAPCITGQEFPPFPASVAQSSKNISALVVDDLACAFRDIQINTDTQPGKQLLSVFTQLIAASNSRRPKPMILAAVGSRTPDLVANAQGFWQYLRQTDLLHPNVVILFDADELRQQGVQISTALSWERTAQELVAAFNTDAALRQFRVFNHIVVRFGVTGAIYIHRIGQRWLYDLFFDPTNDDRAYVDSEKDGIVLGYSSIFVAILLRSLLQSPTGNDLHSAIELAIPDAISRAQMHCKLGYGATTWDLSFSKAIFEDRIPEEFLPEAAIGHVSVPHFQSKSWSILTQTSEFRVYDIARQIVTDGLFAACNQPAIDSLNFKSELLNKSDRVMLEAKDPASQATIPLDVERMLLKSRFLFGTRPAELRRAFMETVGVPDLVAEYIQTPKRSRAAKKLAIYELIDKRMEAEDGIFDILRPVATPLARFGAEPSSKSRDNRLVVLDREEVESFRTVRNLIKSHLDSVASGTNERPLSIAVFGPPGSGKSFSVRAIIDSISTKQKTEFVQFNLAQFARSTDLDDAFQRITSISAGECVPVAFIDEFDSQFDNDEPLGWLKFFLAPMEDGIYKKSQPVKDAILVFAGGTSGTFTEFSREGRPANDQQAIMFTNAKGPDFLSRLRGHLNIVGINPRPGDDGLFMIRRALLMRALLVKLESLDRNERARIDEDMLRGFLRASEYKHGGRSMRTMLELCLKDGDIGKSSLPTPGQLNMHVDGNAFLNLIHQGKGFGNSPW